MQVETKFCLPGEVAGSITSNCFFFGTSVSARFECYAYNNLTEVYEQVRTKCQDQGYRSSVNSIFGFLVQIGNNFQYYNVIVPYTINIAQQRRLTGEEIKQLLEDNISVALAGLIVALSEQMPNGQTISVVALEENYSAFAENGLRHSLICGDDPRHYLGLTLLGPKVTIAKKGQKGQSMLTEQ
ncbi:hypothetical protein D6810_01035 [Candidatus Dojkabacteria bacterium]|uniref:Uncharacterized protein n=1 Tax=Candidatus Dojkabacteria bacterium TaxID=2099670 RepID=A0A3M0YZ92_9BACT|nr:MAG: hypothetical protein D6810_01035 [Candidatus Dojkabacteria bacterium]